MLDRALRSGWDDIGDLLARPKINALLLEENAHLLSEFGPNSVVRNRC